MNLRAKLERLARRGSHRSTDEVWSAATSSTQPIEPAGSRFRPSRPWAAFAFGFGAVAALALLTAVVFDLGTGGQPVGSLPEPSTTSTTELLPEPESLSPDFVSWVFPLDETEYRRGSEVFEHPFFSFEETAACLRSLRFETYADALLADDLPTSSLGLSRYWMPRPAVREGAGPENYPAMALLTVAVPPSESDDKDFWVAAIERNVEQRPWLGVDTDRAEEFYDAVAQCRGDRPSWIEYPAGRPFEVTRDLQSRWLEEIFRVDSDPAVAAAVDGVAACLAADESGFFDGVEDAERAVGRFDRFGSVALDDEAIEEMHRLSDLYYECMGPVVEARRAVRLEARERMVEENQERLLSMQEDIRRAIDRLER